MDYKKAPSIGYIIDHIRRCTRAVSKTVQLDAELLLSCAIEKGRAWVISHPEEILSKQQELKVCKLIEQRMRGKSIAQILGERGFWKYKFIVSDDTLVPRPDSETLISALCVCFSHKKGVMQIADFGTGTGCLIISALLEYKNWRGFAFEKSKSAHAIACKNVQLHNLSSRINLVFGSWDKCNRSLDIIISNPPYIRQNMIESLPDAISKYEPRIALNGGNNGLRCYQSVIRVAIKCLRVGGSLLLEVSDHKQMLEIRKIITHTSLEFHKLYKDLSGVTRCIGLIKRVL